MAQLNRTQLKAKFENGDIPTQADFADLIDSLALKSEINSGGGDQPTISTISLDVSNPLMRFLCFNSQSGYNGYRGVLGSPYISDSSQRSTYLSNNLNNMTSIIAKTGTTSSISYLGSLKFNDSEVANMSVSLTGSKQSILPAATSSIDDDWGIVRFNPSLHTLDQILPITLSGMNPTLSFEQANVNTSLYIENGIITGDTNIWQITGFMPGFILERVYIGVEYRMSGAEYSPGMINIIDFNQNYTESDIQSITITSELPIYCPMPIDFDEYVYTSSSDIAIEIDIKGTYNNVPFSGSNKLYGDELSDYTWYDTPIWDISSIIADIIGA